MGSDIYLRDSKKRNAKSGVRGFTWNYFRLLRGIADEKFAANQSGELVDSRGFTNFTLFTILVLGDLGGGFGVFHILESSVCNPSGSNQSRIMMYA